MDTNQRTRSVLGAAAATGVVLFLAGCGDDGSGSGGAYGGGEGTGGGATSAPTVPGESDPPAATDGSDAAEEVLIVIKDFTYTVPDTVQAGATITVRNDDTVGHTVTSDEDGVFDFPVGPGEEVQLTVPAESGEYSFHCTPHPDMTGTLVVGEPDDQSAAPDGQNSPAY